MKPSARSIAAASIAGVVIAVAASSAQAGLDFTDTAALGGSSSPDVTFNGAQSGSATPVTVPSGFNPISGPVTITTIGSALGTTIETARVLFSYTGLNGGITTATYAPFVGSPAYTMVVDFGAINVAAGASLTLQSVEFQNAGGGFSPAFGVNQLLTSANSGQKLFIFVPSSGANSVALNQRNDVQTLALTFTFNGGSGTSFDIRAVVNPEPGTYALFGLGAVGLLGVVRGRRKSRTAGPQTA